MIYFLHVPKTAGSTIRSILAQNFNTEARFFWRNSNQDKKYLTELLSREPGKTKLIAGHFAYGLHETLATPGSYFTILRHPVDRFVSEYNYFDKVVRKKQGSQLKAFVNNPAYKTIIDNGASLRDFTNNSPTYMDNIFVRMISGRVGLNRDVTASDLEDAKECLSCNVDVFGIAERFDESALLIARQYKFRCPIYVMKNVGDGQEVLPDLVDRIADKQKYDIELYNYALNIFDRHIARNGELFQSALVEFQSAVREVNRRYDRPTHQDFGVMSEPDAIALDAGRACKTVERYLRQEL